MDPPWTFFRNAAPEAPKLRSSVDASGRRNLPPGDGRRIPLLEIPAVEGGDCFWGRWKVVTGDEPHVKENDVVG